MLLKVLLRSNCAIAIDNDINLDQKYLSMYIHVIY